MTAPTERAGLRVVLRGLVFLATLAAVGWLVRETGLKSLIDTAWIDTHIRGRGVAGEALFIGMAAAFTAVGLPRQIIAFLGGYAFGLPAGAALALLGTSLGCAATFLYARFLGRAVIAQRFPGRVRKADLFLREHTLSTTLMIRLLPVGSNVVTNLVAGVSSVRFAPFLAGSVAGFLPQTLIFALVGSGVDVSSRVQIAVGAGLFVLSGAIGIQLYRRNRAARAIADNGDGEDNG